ncbi:hypothetical protein EJ02DRAFT_463964 [Clathrospora elynae]|uniref:Uncharacterized protein n=1 Tax=Clathrospora elynae TaxID=706981 RepID=A0A6A5T1P8_9PLEO|nr:hypothetical protein EJ02DRAFT_463964 [Clathrospora elynae]
MSPPTCSGAAFRLLTSVLLVTSNANPVALPHQLLDPRELVALTGELPSSSEIAAVLDAVASPEPNNDTDYGGDTDKPVTVTVSATPMPTLTPNVSMVIPSGPPSSTTLDVNSASTVPRTATPETSDVFSVPLICPVTTAISIPQPDPSSVVVILPRSLRNLLPDPSQHHRSCNAHCPSSLTINVTYPAIDAPYANTICTLSLPTPIPGTGTASPLSSGTGIGLPISFSSSVPYLNTTYVSSTAVVRSGTDTPVIGTISCVPVVDSTISLSPNGTGNTTTTIAASNIPTLLPIPTLSVPNPTNDTVMGFPGLFTFRSICQDPQIKVITPPQTARVYGSYAYPPLSPFPSCICPNARQALQAPGLFDCTALSVEVQRCQTPGGRVLLGVKANGFEVVGRNADFGDSATTENPYGPHFGCSGLERGLVGETNKVVMKRQLVSSLVLVPSFPINNFTAPPVLSASAPVPSGFVSSVILSGFAPVSLTGNTGISASLSSAPSASLPTASSGSTPAISASAPIIPQSTYTLASIPYPTPSSLDPTAPFSNLFNKRHLPSSFALTLFSLFDESHTERALQRLRGLNSEAWGESGGVARGSRDAGANGKGIGNFGWVGEMLKARGEEAAACSSSRYCQHYLPSSLSSFRAHSSPSTRAQPSPPPIPSGVHAFPSSYPYPY